MTQRAVLSKVRELHACAPRRDGQDPWVDMYDRDVNGRMVRLDTLRALERAGLIELDLKLRTSEVLDLGPFGRWRGGTRSVRWWNYWVRPVGGA